MQRNTFRQAALDHTTPKVQTRTDTVGDPWKGHFRTCFEHCDEAHSITSLVFGFAACAVGGCDDLSCAFLGLLCEFSRLHCEFDWRGNLSGSDFGMGVALASVCTLFHLAPWFILLCCVIRTCSGVSDHRLCSKMNVCCSFVLLLSHLIIHPVQE